MTSANTNRRVPVKQRMEGDTGKMVGQAIDDQCGILAHGAQKMLDFTTLTIEPRNKMTLGEAWECAAHTTTQVMKIILELIRNKDIDVAAFCLESMAGQYAGGKKGKGGKKKKKRELAPPLTLFDARSNGIDIDEAIILYGLEEDERLMPAREFDAKLKEVIIYSTQFTPMQWMPHHHIFLGHTKEHGAGYYGNFFHDRLDRKAPWQIAVAIPDVPFDLKPKYSQTHTTSRRGQIHRSMSNMIQYNLKPYNCHVVKTLYSFFTQWISVDGMEQGLRDTTNAWIIADPKTIGSHPVWQRMAMNVESASENKIAIIGFGTRDSKGIPTLKKRPTAEQAQMLMAPENAWPGFLFAVRELIRVSDIRYTEGQFYARPILPALFTWKCLGDFHSFMFHVANFQSTRYFHEGHSPSAWIASFSQFGSRIIAVKDDLRELHVNFGMFGINIDYCVVEVRNRIVFLQDPMFNLENYDLPTLVSDGQGGECWSMKIRQGVKAVRYPAVSDRMIKWGEFLFYHKTSWGDRTWEDTSMFPSSPCRFWNIEFPMVDGMPISDDNWWTELMKKCPNWYNIMENQGWTVCQKKTVMNRLFRQVFPRGLKCKIFMAHGASDAGKSNLITVIRAVFKNHQMGLVAPSAKESSFTLQALMDHPYLIKCMLWEEYEEGKMPLDTFKKFAGGERFTKEGKNQKSQTDYGWRGFLITSNLTFGYPHVEMDAALEPRIARFYMPYELGKEHDNPNPWRYPRKLFFKKKLGVNKKIKKEESYYACLMMAASLACWPGLLLKSNEDFDKNMGGPLNDIIPRQTNPVLRERRVKMLRSRTPHKFMLLEEDEGTYYLESDDEEEY